MSGRRRLLVGLLTGLATSTFSTVFVTWGGRHVGRDPTLDFQEVSTWILRSRGITPRSDRRAIAAGVASHQFADIFWAVVFFTWVLPRMPVSRRRGVQASIVPWGVGTAAAEYYVFLPWIQPWLRMQVPFWTVVLAHLGSTAAYPVYPFARRVLGEETTADEQRLARRTAVGLASTLVLLGSLWWWSTRHGDLRWPGVDRDGEEESFLRRMIWHHRVGLRMADIAVERATDSDLRKLTQLIALQHDIEIDFMRHWYRSFFGSEPAEMADTDRGKMAGMPSQDAVDELERLSGDEFDRRFVQLMIPHHDGAVEMAREAEARAEDRRVRLLAAGIRHTQIGQIEQMRRST